MLKQQHKWWVVSTGAAMLASSLTWSALERGWQSATGRRPPRNPAAPGVSFRAAFAWAVVAGVVVSVSELLAQRGAAAGWKRVTGKYPRGLKRNRT